MRQAYLGLPDGNAVGDEGIGAVEETEGAPMEQLEEAGDERDDRDDCKVWFKGPSNPLTPLTLAGLRVARGLQPLLAAALLNRGTTSLPSSSQSGSLCCAGGVAWRFMLVSLYRVLLVVFFILDNYSIVQKAVAKDQSHCQASLASTSLWCGGACTIPTLEAAAATCQSSFSRSSPSPSYQRCNGIAPADERTARTPGTAQTAAPHGPTALRQKTKRHSRRGRHGAIVDTPMLRRGNGHRNHGCVQQTVHRVDLPVLASGKVDVVTAANSGVGKRCSSRPQNSMLPRVMGRNRRCRLLPHLHRQLLVDRYRCRPLLEWPLQVHRKPQFCLHRPRKRSNSVRSLTQKLKKHQDLGMELPEDVQDDLKDVCIKEAKSQRKTMHLAVNAMDDARQVYDDAVRARAQLHLQWKSFLAESLKLWQGHTTSFQSQEAQLTARIQEAKDAFVQARDALNAAKIEAANMVPVDAKSTVTVSDDEEIKDLKDVPMAAAERIATGLSNLVETMSVLHHQTEELVQEEQRAKRPRVQPEQPGVAPSEAAPVGGALASSAPPFGTPGGQ